MTWLLYRPAWLVAGAAIALRAILLAAYPAIFGGDSVVRLANADRVLLSYQLPALQAIVHAFWLVRPGCPWGSRFFLVFVSGVAAAGAFRFARNLLPSGSALVAALLFALNPFLVAYSIVPYQEMLMLAGLCWAFAWAIERRELPAALALGFACLTRYEAWLACPAIVWILWNNGPRTPKRLLHAAALCGVVPLAWIFRHAGLTPTGSFAVEAAANPERLWRWAYLGWITVKNAWFALPAAALGALALVRERRWREPVWQALASFAALFAAAILFSAHGERATPDRFVTAREAHLPIAFVCLLAGFGVAKLRRRGGEAATAMLLLSVLSAERFVARETSEPHTALAYRAARLLARRVQPGQTAIVLAKPNPRPQLEQFLAISERQGGAPGRDAALGVLRSLHVEPSDYQRILVQTPYTRDTLLSLAVLPEDLVPVQRETPPITPDWVLRWSDFEPSSGPERQIAALIDGKTPVERLEAGAVSLDLYRLVDGQ